MATPLEARLKQDEFLRREAGEDSEKGLDTNLLKLLIAREVAIEAIVNDRVVNVDSKEHSAYLYLAGVAEAYKKEYEIPEPVPLSTDDV